MMRARYIRFREAVMTPGRAGTTIKKGIVLRAKNDPRGAMVSPDERMLDILVDDAWVVLRAMRKDENGKEYLAERLTHASNVQDVELVELLELDEDTPPKGKSR